MRGDSMKVTTGINYDVKIELSKETGICEVVKYADTIKVDLAQNFGTGKREVGNEQYIDNKRKTVWKSGNRLRQLVRYNAGQYKKRNGSKFPPIFLTLTFTENVQDWKYANREFSKFIQRLNYFVYGEKCTRLAYVGVPELQERGAIHYHVLFFNLPYVDKKKIKELWGLGERTRIESERLKDMNGESLGKYITKYMMKQFYSKDKCGKEVFVYNKEIWEGKKVYFASRNLYRPSVYKLTVEEYLDLSWVFEGEKFDSELIVGKLKYDNGEEEDRLIGVREYYKLGGKDKLDFLVKILLSCNDKSVKTDFAIGCKNENVSIKKMIRLDKIVKESPKERYARIKDNLELDNKWDSMKDKFVEVDMEYIF